MIDAQPSGAEARTEPDLSGRRLGDYLLTRRLARGGMADVYLAEQQSLRRQVAFKVLRSTLASDETYVRRFHHEAQAAASLVHANIVQIYEVGCIDGVHFIAQEYVAGQNLKQLISRRGSLKVPLAVDVIRQVAAALQRASSRGIVHRDIKPENIMLASTGEVKVADFGLARVTGDGGELNLTQVGVTLGTPLYMSPEQVEGRVLDPRSDLYSFGVTCYEMLAGRPPFTGDTALSVAVQHLNSEPPRLEDVRPDLPGGLCRIVHKMLAKKPAQRYQDAAELLRELRTLAIEGLEGEWPGGAENSVSAEQNTAVQARTAGTQQLATVMATESLVLQRGGRGSWLAIGLLVAFCLGSSAAWLLRPSSLLAVAGNVAATVDRKESAEAQFWYAMDLYTEAAFLAVTSQLSAAREPGERGLREQGRTAAGISVPRERPKRKGRGDPDETGRARFRSAGPSHRTGGIGQHPRLVGGKRPSQPASGPIGQGPGGLGRALAARAIPVDPDAAQQSAGTLPAVLGGLPAAETGETDKKSPPPPGAKRS